MARLASAFPVMRTHCSHSGGFCGGWSATRRSSPHRGQQLRCDWSSRRLSLSSGGGGNFRLIQRLFAQIERLMAVNNSAAVTAELVDAARESLVASAL